MEKVKLPNVNLPIRKASVSDFHTNGKKKTGMIYLLLNQVDKLEVYRLKEKTKGEEIKPFIDQGKCFVIADVNDVCCELEMKEMEVDFVGDGVEIAV